MSSERLTKDRLRRAILQEFKMLGMGSPAPMQMKSLSDCDTDVGHGGVEIHSLGMMGQGSVSREACCEAVMCMVECCACPITKAALIECCQAIISGEYDQ